MYIHVYVILQRERMRQRDTMKGIDEEERKRWNIQMQGNASFACA